MKTTSTSISRSKRKLPLKGMTADYASMDIIRAVKEDHKDLKKFIKVMKDEDSNLNEVDAAYRKFSALLKSHAPSEEKALYGKCLNEGDMGVETHEAYVEHELATLLMKSIEATRDGERRHAQIKALSESVEHHIKEEEGHFLPDVKKEFSKDELLRMGDEFLRLRKSSQSKTSKDNQGVLDRQVH